MSDYLFDKEGAPDPEIERLETLLAPLAYRGQAPALAVARPARRAWIPVAALAAAALVAIVVARPWRWLAHPTTAGWALAADGSARCDGRPCAARLAVGATLETGGARARLDVGAIGTVTLAPGSRARLVEAGARQRIALERGTLEAHIAAPPRTFAVETRHVVVTDLGCAFTVTVDDDGVGRVVVTEGRVALSSGGREVEVAAGGSCALAAAGPGTPFATHAAAAAPAPSAPPPIAPAPAPIAPKHTNSKPHAPPHATHVRAPAPRPTPHTPPSTTKVQPTTKPATKKADDHPTLKHDAIKDLERSGE